MLQTTGKPAGGIIGGWMRKVDGGGIGYSGGIDPVIEITGGAGTQRHLRAAVANSRTPLLLLAHWQLGAMSVW